MPRAPKPCGRFGCDELVVGRTYCSEHARRPPSPSSIAARDPKERARRSQAVAEWVAVNGWVCPGYERAPHESRDLTARHTTPVAHGGTEIRGVLCRSCNSRENTKSA